MSEAYFRKRIFLRILLWTSIIGLCCGQQQDPTTLNGGSVLAMAGDGCVALAIDKRFGSGSQMVNVAPRHVLTPHANLMVAFTGLEGDIQSLSEELSIQIASKAQRGALGFMSSRAAVKNISPRAMATLVSHVLYGRRQSPYYVEPIVVGLDPISNIPFLCAQDLIGAQSKSEAFCCAGVASKSMFGTAEALWRPGLSNEELVQVCGKAFLSALERDCLSGYGAVIYLISKSGIVAYDLRTRND